jgi:membrane protease YdiL (CAAX protease family)
MQTRVGDDAAMSERDEALDYHAKKMSARPPRRKWAASELLAWLVIVLSVILLAGVPLVLKSQSPENKTLAAEKHPQMQTLLSGRYLVGLNALMPLKSVGQSGAALAAMDKAAKGGADKFRIAIVHGEIEGKDKALELVEKLSQTHGGLKKDTQVLRALYADEPPSEVEGWEDFRERHDWFADLAASTGKPESDPLRRSTLYGAMRTTISVVSMVLAILALGLLGLPLLVIGAVLFFRGKLVPAFDRHVSLPEDRRTYVQSFAIYLGLMASVAGGIRLFLYLNPQSAWLTLWLNLAMPAGFFLGLIWPLLRKQRWSDLRATLGLHTGRGVGREILCGAAGYVAGIPVFALGIAITFLLTKLSGLEAAHPIVNQVSTDPVRLLLIFTLASVFAPITEELMFRGALFGHLRERFGFWISALVVAFVFAIIHPQGWPAVPALGSLAVVFAGIREWRGSIIGPIVAHAINNTGVLIMVTLMLG